MRTERKVLVIENQENQFNRIYEGLGDFCVYPEKKDFVGFIDHVRVWVTKGYEKKYQELAIQHIMHCISDHGTEIILMDHILGGAHDCLDGISLATEINARLKKAGRDVLPVVFLSKTEHTMLKKFIDYTTYEVSNKNKTEWVPKGFFGEETLDPDHFKDYVIKAINNCLPMTEEQQFWDDLGLVLDLEYAPNQDHIRANLLEIKEQDRYNSLSKAFKDSVVAARKSRIVDHIKFDQN